MRDSGSNHPAGVDPQELLFEGSSIPMLLVALIAAGTLFSTGLLNSFGILTSGENPNYLEASLGFLLAAVVVYLAIRLRKADNVQTAKFYDTYFIVKMRKASLSVGYSEIEKASKSSDGLVDSIFGPRMTIKLKGSTDLLTFHGSSRNRKLGVDLYSWLLGKSIGEHEVSRFVRGV
jgi:hypothetical protein